MLEKMPNPNLISWTSTISSFLRSQNPKLALREFFLMCNSGLNPNEFALPLALKASQIANKPIVGKLIHGYTIKSGFESYPYCSTSILDMYSKTGNVGDARKFFNLVPDRCDALWNTIIDGYARYPDENEALNLFHEMSVSHSSELNSFTYTILIKLSGDGADIGLLRFFHGRTVKIGLDYNSFVGGALVDAYGKWGEIGNATRVFWNLDERDLVVWTSLLVGFRYNDDVEQGINLYLRFVSDGYKLDPFMFANILSLCSDSQNVRFGLQLHACLAKTPFLVDSFVRSELIDMYVSFGLINDASRIFLKIEEKNEVIYAAMINGFVSGSDYKSAIALVYEMRKLRLVLDHSTLSCILKAFTSLDLLEEGRIFHGMIMKSVGKCDLVIGNNLIEMYSRYRDITKAVNVFMSMEVHNEFSYTTLISGYNESEMYEEALNLYQRMVSSTSIEPNQFTYVALLHAISKLQDLLKGKQIHSHITKTGFQSHAYIETSLIGMYSKCEHLADAYRVFSNMSHRDLISWSYMISSYAQQGKAEKALKLLSEHENGLISIDESILSSVLSACSSLAALEMGKAIHAGAIKIGYLSYIQVGAGIIDMYCKCGCINEAQEFFNKMKNHNEVTCTAMICGYAQHGLGAEALSMFDLMKSMDLKPDEVTFVGVLSACSHCGLVNEGWMHFESIKTKYGLEKTENHFACMVDILGRAGKVKEAEKLIEEVPFRFRSKSLLWRTLLGACNKYGNVEDGNRIAEMLIDLKPDEASNYVILSNLYSSASMWGQSIELKNKIGQGGLMKTPGCSWIL